MPYTNAIKWIIDNNSPQDRSFNDDSVAQLTSFRPEAFARAYALRQPDWFLNAKFLDAARTQFNFDEILKSWMNNPTSFTPKDDKSYPISWFKESLSLLAAMIFILYGLPDCSLFKSEWAPLAHHVLTTGKSFN
jgi:hypothetical protein